MDLLILASHPIQYQACVWRSLAGLGELDVEVWYGSNYGVVAQKSGWGLGDFRWDVDLTSGYRHRFLPNWSWAPDPQSFFGKVYPPLALEVLRARPKVVMVQGYGNLFDHLALLSAKLSHARVVFRSDNNELTPRAGLKKQVRTRVLRHLYGRIDAFLTIGEPNAAHYRFHGVPEHKLFAAPYGVDERHFQALGQQLRAQHGALKLELGVPVEAPLIATACVLGRVKGLDTLIDAVGLLPGAHLAVAGSGPLRAELERQAERVAPGRVHFTGFLNQSRLPRVYAAADVFCLPSRFEPWGLVINEAIATGTPVVVSSVCGAADDVRTFGAGLVVPPEDPPALAASLRAVLDDPRRFDAGLEHFTNGHRTELTARAILDAARGGRSGGGERAVR